MKKTRQRTDSVWSLRLDLMSARALVWMAIVGRDADLTPDAHLYFAARYGRLARCHQAHGRPARAAQLQAKADRHYQMGGGDVPPYAAAMAMPRPRRFVRTDAVARHRLDAPDDAA
jgi:hypothetical protein